MMRFVIQFGTAARSPVDYAAGTLPLQIEGRREERG